MGGGEWEGLKTSIGRFLESWKVPFGYHPGVGAWNLTAGSQSPSPPPAAAALRHLRCCCFFFSFFFSFLQLEKRIMICCRRLDSEEW